jgi:hypothetical protein
VGRRNLELLNLSGGSHDGYGWEELDT